MTAPTQAQIEAARALLSRFLCLKTECVNRPLVGLKECSCVRRVAELLALTAAAQVGEPSPKNFRAEVYKAVVDRTIERCAQVVEADTMNNRMATARIAAAIRKLKDKPSAPPDDDRIFPRGP